MTRIRLRHIIYFIAGILLILNAPRPICRITPEGLFYTGLSFIVVITGLELFFLIRRSYQVKAHLDRGDVKKFLEDTEGEIKYAAGQWKRCYQINKTAGLYYLGRFEEAIDLLDTIEYRKLPKLYRALYINNRLANLLGAKRIEEAQKLIESNETVFQPTVQNRPIYHALQSNLGVYKYLKGERQTARYLLEESLKSHQNPLGQAMAYYYLGCIARDEGQPSIAQEHFLRAKELGKNIYIADLLR